MLWYHWRHSFEHTHTLLACISAGHTHTHTNTVAHVICCVYDTYNCCKDDYVSVWGYFTRPGSVMLAKHSLCCTLLMFWWALLIIMLKSFVCVCVSYRQISKKHQMRIDTPWLDPTRTLLEQEVTADDEVILMYRFHYHIDLVRWARHTPYMVPNVMSVNSYAVVQTLVSYFTSRQGMI